MEHFNLLAMDLKILAPTSWTDAQAEKVLQDIEETLKQTFKDYEKILRAIHPNLVLTINL